MATLLLSFLGRFQASLDDRPIPGFQTRKVQALLIYLAAEPDKHLRESLMNLMWPGMPERSARHNLRQVLYYLRGAIPDLQSNQEGSVDKVSLLLTNRQMIRLNPEASVQVDAAHFESLMNKVQTHEHINVLTCQTCLANIEEAIDLYQGDFLIDFFLDDSNAYEEWAQVTREAYRRKALDALEVLTAAATRQGEYPKAQALAKRQLEIDNLRENAYRQLMEALALSGQREEALSVYENCRHLLAEELSMAPANRTTELAEKIQAGDLSFDSPLAKGVRGYELKEEIGVGGFGTIHRAYQSAISREVAVKVIRRRYANDPEFIRRFEDEAQTVARLEHPYIVPLYDYWRDPDGAYLVMRYMRGGNLLSALEANPWGIEPASQMIDQVASALSVAHLQGIIHRDIKPANILLDENGNAYLSDFGVAKDLGRDRQLTAAGAVIGTPDYISPEQILNEPVGPQSDIYSLGAVLFETLTGEKPYGDSSVANLIYKQLNDPFPLVSASRPDLPPEIDSVILKATAKRPADRYQDAMEMAEAFRHIWAGSSSTEVLSVPTAIPAGIDVYNPYKGLQAFQEADADNFFGRDAIIDRLIRHMAPSQTPSYAASSSEGGDWAGGRFLALVGPSGSGKSSIVKAGLLPALRSGAVPDSEKWFFAEMVPGIRPLEELEMALWPVAVDAPPSLVEPMQRDVRGLLRTIRRILPDAGERQDAQLLLVIDQFEELFTLIDDEERRNFFLDSLLAAISAPRSPLRVVVTLRADFYDRPLQYQALGSLLKASTEIVLPMTSEELTWAVREPARRTGVRLEEGLAEVIVADVANQPGSLPLMQYALTELFERRQGNQMTREAYQEIGGVLGALSRRAEELYGKLNEVEREAARQLFLRLVTLGEGAEDTRRRVLRSELLTITNGQQPTVNNQRTSSNEQQLTKVIDSFGAARLLTFDHDPVTRGGTVEVAHEALLREWVRYRSWLDENRDHIRRQRLLAIAAAQWAGAGEDASYLLRGNRLTEFVAWAEMIASDPGAVALTAQEHHFLEASFAAHEQQLAEEQARQKRELETARKLTETESKRAEEQANSARILRQRAAFLAGALVVAALLAIAAFLFARQSNQNAIVAQDNAVLATTREAQAQAETLQRATAQAQAETERVRADGQRDAALAAEAEAKAEADLRAKAEAEAILEREMAEQQARLATSRELSLAALTNLESDPELSILLALEALDTSHTKEAEEALHQGLQTSRVLMTLSEHTDRVYGAIYSPDGSKIATASDDGTVKLWEAASGQLLQTMPYTGIYLWGATLTFNESGDELALVAAGENFKSAILHEWDSVSGELISQKELPIGFEIWGMALSPDWKSVVAGGENGAAELWDVEVAERIFDYSNHEDTVSGITFNPDGSRLAITSKDGQVTILDIEASLAAGEGQPVATFETANETLLVNARFSNDSTRLILGFTDSELELWNLEDTSQALFVLKGHTNVTTDFAFHPDDIYLATGGGDSTVKVWDSRTGEELFTLSGHKGFIQSLNFSPDGSRLATAGNDGTSRIWNVMPHAGGELSTFGLTPPAMDLELSPNESKFALGSGAGPATVWDAATGKQLLSLQGEPDTGVYRVAFSPDGSRIATVGEDGIARIWDSETGNVLLAFTGHTGGNSGGIFTGALDVSYSPDGNRLATAGADGVAKVWDSETGDELLALAGHTAGLHSLAYSPDGRYIATSSDSPDTTVKVWDAQTGTELYSFGPNPGRAWGLAFSPDSNQLGAGGQGGYIKVWDMNTGKQVSNMTGQASTISTVGFTPNGQQLISGGGDSVSIWDIVNGTELLNLAPDSSYDFALSQDGRRLYTATSQRPAVRVYAVPLEDVSSLAESRVTRELTTAECLQYLHLDECPLASSQ